MNIKLIGNIFNDWYILIILQWFQLPNHCTLNFSQAKPLPLLVFIRAYYCCFCRFVKHIFLLCCNRSNGHASRVDSSQHHSTRSPAKVESSYFQCRQLRTDPHTQPGWVVIWRAFINFKHNPTKGEERTNLYKIIYPFSLKCLDFWDVKYPIVAIFRW